MYLPNLMSRWTLLTWRSKQSEAPCWPNTSEVEKDMKRKGWSHPLARGGPRVVGG